MSNNQTVRIILNHLTLSGLNFDKVEEHKGSLVT